MPNKNQDAKPVANLDPKFAWEILQELGASERHFNALETEYRKLASIWLLASFGGMGFLLKNDPGLAIPREVAIAGIGLAGSIGIFLLWIVDLLVYHRLLDACFTEAKAIERAHPELPQVRTRMGKSQAGGRVVTTRLRWFYIALTAAPLAFSIPLVTVWCARLYGTGVALSVVAAALGYAATTTLLIWTKSLHARE
jgi:hypothetical protein